MALIYDILESILNKNQPKKLLKTTRNNEFNMLKSIHQVQTKVFDKKGKHVFSYICMLYIRSAGTRVTLPISVHGQCTDVTRPLTIAATVEPSYLTSPDYPNTYPKYFV